MRRLPLAASAALVLVDAARAPAADPGDRIAGSRLAPTLKSEGGSTGAASGISFLHATPMSAVWGNAENIFS